MPPDKIIIFPLNKAVKFMFGVVVKMADVETEKKVVKNCLTKLVHNISFLNYHVDITIQQQ